jgi:hypothetical protein
MSDKNCKTLSASAQEFVPKQKASKSKKTKDERTAPRRRKRKDKCSANNESVDNDNDTVDSSKTSSHGTEWVDWLHGMVGEIISSNSAREELSTDIDLKDGRNSEKWLDLQAEWLVSKQLLCDPEYVLEAAERKKWGEWATYASEMERKRRIFLLESIDAAERKERHRRRVWAIEAIETEKRERISAQFLSSISSTQWFSEAISAYHEDYEVVCPYYKYGCTIQLRRSKVKEHLTTCRYALEIGTLMNSELNTMDYEIVCPNTVLGCTYIGGGRTDIYLHLATCSFRGKSFDEENAERSLLRQHVSANSA